MPRRRRPAWKSIWADDGEGGGELRPEPLDLGQLSIGIDRCGQCRINARIFVPHQHARGESAFAAHAPAPHAGRADELLVHRDVVEIAECILQRFERRLESFAPLRGPLARKQAAEEFRCVADLLGLDSQLMAALRIEPRDRFAFSADLLPAPVQLAGGGNLDRDLADVTSSGRPSVPSSRRSPAKPRCRASGRETAPISPHPAHARAQPHAFPPVRVRAKARRPSARVAS